MQASGRNLGAFRLCPCYNRVVEDTLSNRELRDLKGRGQLLRPTVFIGKEGVSAAVIKSLDDALAHHELVKVKFMDFKEQKKELAPLLAEKTASRLVMRVGNVAVLFRKKPAPASESSPA